MSAGADHFLDRHVLSSGPALVDSGKDTFAWTPGLAGERAARLKNEVPWGVATAGAENPPRLEGGAVLQPENYLRLHFAWIPLDGRMGFCVWGAIGDRPLGRSVWRVLTHTALMDAEAFRAMESNPFALLKRGVAGDWMRDLATPRSFDERRQVEPIRVVDTAESRNIAETLRRDDISRLRGRLCGLLGAGVLERRLAALYATLSSAPHVALASTGDRQAEMLVRLAWLTLPPADRWQTSFSTEQGASAGALPRLMALDLTEWQGRVPPETFLFQEAPPEGADPSEGQRMWAADVVRDESLREHALAHAFAAGRGLSLLSGPQLDRYARHRSAVADLRAGARGLEMLKRLAGAQVGGLLSPPLRAGLLMGLPLRRSAMAPAAMADALRKELERLPEDGRNVVARGMVRALALDEESAVLAEADADPSVTAGEPPLPAARAATPERQDELRAAALLRCGAVRMRLVSAAELARVLDGEAEGPLLAPLLESAGGPAALLAAISAAGDDALLDRLEPVRDAAVARLSETELNTVLDALEFGSGPSAVRGIRMYQAAERRGYRPSASVLRSLLPYGGHAAVREYLARPERLSTVFSPEFAEEAGAYIRQVQPDSLSLATALVEVARRMTHVSSAPLPRTTRTAFAAPAPVTPPDEGVVADALKYLLTRENAGRVIDRWRDGREEPDSRLLLLSHPAWEASPLAEQARTAAALLVERAPAPEAEGPALSSAAVTRALQQVVTSDDASFSDAEGRLVAAAITFMARRNQLHLLGPKMRDTLLRRIACRQAAHLAVSLLKEQGGSGTGEFSHDLVGTVLRSGEAQGGLSTLRWLFEALPPGEHRQYWAAFFNQPSPDVLARDDVLAMLAESLRGREGAPLAGIVLKRAIDHLASFSPDVLDAVNRLAWTELVYLERSVFDGDARGNAGLRVQLIVRLLARSAPFPLPLHLAEVLLRLVPEREGGAWTQGLLQEHEINALMWISPSSYARLRPREEQKRVIFLPQDFRIKPPEPVMAVESRAEPAAEPRQSRKR